MCYPTSVRCTFLSSEDAANSLLVAIAKTTAVKQRFQQRNQNCTVKKASGAMLVGQLQGLLSGLQCSTGSLEGLKGALLRLLGATVMLCEGLTGKS